MATPATASSSNFPPKPALFQPISAARAATASGRRPKYTAADSGSPQREHVTAHRDVGECPLTRHRPQ
eukprot:911818-Prymnesium_polylepis.1